MQDAAAAQEAAPSTTNEAPAQAPEQAPEAPQTPDLGLTPEQAEKFSKFISSNGGFDSAFAKLKADVTGRQKDAPAEPAKAPVVENTTPEPAPAQSQTPVKLAEGFVTPQEMMSQMYNEKLASKPEYAGIKEDIESGAYLKEMASFGMTPVDAAGNLNDAVIRKFLDMKAKTVPAPAPSTPMTNTPLKQYTEFEGDISNFGDAMRIVQEGPGHPRYDEAKKVIGSKFDLPKSEQK